MSIPTCNSPAVLTTEFGVIRKKVTLKETEETWNNIAEGISHLTTLCHNGGCDFVPDMVAGIRSLSRPLTSAMNSERSRLSGTAIDLVSALAIGLGSSFEPLVPLFMPTLLCLCGRTNKIFTSRAKACIFVLIEHTQLPCILHYLADLATHKSAFPRLTAAEGVLACLNCFNPPDLEKENRARMVEDFIKMTARDASADVRKVSKKIFEAFKTLMPSRVDSFVAPLTPTVKKYLDIPSNSSIRHPVNSGREVRSHGITKQVKTLTRVDVGTRPGGVQYTSHVTRSAHLPAGRGPPKPSTATLQGPRPDSALTTRGPQRPTSKASTSSSRNEVSGPVHRGGAKRILLPTADAVLKTGSTLTDKPTMGSRSNSAPSKGKVTTTIPNGGPARSTVAARGKPIKVQKRPTSKPASAKPEISPATIPLPPSPVSSLERDGQSCADKPINPPEQRPTTETTGTPPFLLAPLSDSPSKTPITALLSSIQRGFLFTPSSPLSPPQTYLLTPSADESTKQVGEDRSADPSFESTRPLHRSLKQDFMDAVSMQISDVVDPSID